jgi:hypothetical protein
VGMVMLSVSAIVASGGLLMYAFVPDGPHLRPAALFDPTAFAAIFRSAQFRASSFGYFGHMWELYAFWAFVPAYLAAYDASVQGISLNISLWSFLAIGAGAIGCIVGGLVSPRLGSINVAFAQLTASGACCVLSPLAFGMPYPVLLAFVLFWGAVVVGDSPQFSALNAYYAPSHLVGSALTVVNCIGFQFWIVIRRRVSVERSFVSCDSAVYPSCSGVRGYRRTAAVTKVSLASSSHARRS